MVSPSSLHFPSVPWTATRDGERPPSPCDARSAGICSLRLPSSSPSMAAQKRRRSSTVHDLSHTAPVVSSLSIANELACQSKYVTQTLTRDPVPSAGASGQECGHGVQTRPRQRLSEHKILAQRTDRHGRLSEHHRSGVVEYEGYNRPRKRIGKHLARHRNSEEDSHFDALQNYVPSSNDVRVLYADAARNNRRVGNPFSTARNSSAEAAHFDALEHYNDLASLHFDAEAYNSRNSPMDIADMIGIDLDAPISGGKVQTGSTSSQRYSDSEKSEEEANHEVRLVAEDTVSLSTTEMQNTQKIIEPIGVSDPANPNVNFPGHPLELSLSSESRLTQAQDGQPEKTDIARAESQRCISQEQKIRMELNKAAAIARRNMRTCEENVAEAEAKGLPFPEFRSLLVEKSWLEAIGGELQKQYMERLYQYVCQEAAAKIPIYPPPAKLFNAFNSCPLEKVKVVIIGQDPYHGLGQAMGLCFSVEKGLKLPSSLANIFKELKNDLKLPLPSHGNLEKWAHQGVLLLNSVLTVRDHHANSHAKKGWEPFTDAAIRAVVQQRDGVIFLLWGNSAQEKLRIINRTSHHILKAAHPSGISANKGFFDCRHFSETNKILEDQGMLPIDWQL